MEFAAQGPGLEKVPHGVGKWPREAAQFHLERRFFKEESETAKDTVFLS